MVKLTPTPYEAAAEAAALRHWAASGAAVRVLDFDAGNDALLLERLRPGTPLPPGDEATAIAVAAQLLGELHRPQPPSFSFLAFEEVYPALERRALDDIAYERRARAEPERGEAGLKLMLPARETAMHLSGTASASVLLHGDFCDKNLLLGGSGYRACDPIPSTGDPCSDVGFFSAGHRPVSRVLARAAAIAGEVGLDSDRCRRWAAISTVHQATQAWRDDQHELESLCSTPELQELLRF